MKLRPADDEGRDDVGGAPVEVVPSPVIPRRRPGIGMASEYLHVAQGDPSVQRRRDCRVTEGVWTDALRNARLLAETAYDASRIVPSHRHPEVGEQHRPPHT